jgi:hypothetical protein
MFKTLTQPKYVEFFSNSVPTLSRTYQSSVNDDTAVVPIFFTMRLLKINSVNGDDVEFELVNREGNPDYAILSHTWGRDSDELSFEDMEKSTGYNKIGYQKVKGFLTEAWRAGLRYGWVDTCCIDKRSSAELSEAINSMFQWYKHAKRCFVYFCDLGGLFAYPSKADLASHLECCRWFTRGWTLQELLAPSDLIFYSQDWQSIGDGEYLKDIIAKITGIHEEALTSDSNKFDRFSIAQKMSWASNRETTRVEDIAYCLMGIFDVNMPLLYGEGDKAFTRLQEQIIKDSDDQTILCWGCETWSSHSDSDSDVAAASFLATSPRDFQRSSRYIPIRTSSAFPYEITNTGLRITGRVRDRGPGFGLRLFLLCYDKTLPTTFVTLPLKRLSPGGDQFSRLQRPLSRGHNDSFSERTIYISKKPTLPPAPDAMGHLVSILLQVDPDWNLSNELKIEQVHPPTCLDPGRMLIHPGVTYFEPETYSLTNYSWHAAMKIRISNSSCVIAFIGYNGRDNKAWCELQSFGYQSDLATSWNSHGHREARRESEASFPIEISTASSSYQDCVLRASIRPVNFSGSFTHTLTFSISLASPQSSASSDEI